MRLGKQKKMSNLRIHHHSIYLSKNISIMIKHTEERRGKQTKAD
jgi:hypothetical protein